MEIMRQIAYGYDPCHRAGKTGQGWAGENRPSLRKGRHVRVVSFLLADAGRKEPPDGELSRDGLGSQHTVVEEVELV
jgi:hypothetical protein